MSSGLHADLAAGPLAAANTGPGGLRAFLAVSLCILSIFGVFWSTTASMVEIWRRSETFQHCFVVIPIALWLVWEQRQRLAATSTRPFWPGLVAVAILGAAWLFGLLAAAQVISQFALVGIVAAAVVTVFGVAWARILWFPLLFLLFAVPFGEIIVPRLMDWTADFTIAALRVSGVPVYREGLHFVIPTGRWSVIDACSGIKFLIASLMAGSLYAFVMYRSWKRRLIFLGASIVLPVIANWLRAYLIVMIGHLTQNRLMTNDDHIVFGWVVFGAFMLLLYWWGARWREDRDADPGASGTGAATPLVRLAPAAVATAVVVAAWPVIGQALARPIAESDAPIVAPAPLGNWRPAADDVLETWKPYLKGVDGDRVFVYENAGRRVALLVGAYRNQTQDSQVGSSANQLVRTDGRMWRQTGEGTRRTEGLGTSAVPDLVRVGEVRSEPDARLLVWHWYWTGAIATSSASWTKVELARARLLGRPDAALWIAAYTAADEDGGNADRALADFVRDMGASLESAFRASVAR